MRKLIWLIGNLKMNSALGLDGIYLKDFNFLAVQSYAERTAQAYPPPACGMQWGKSHTYQRARGCTIAPSYRDDCLWAISSTNSSAGHLATPPLGGIQKRWSSQCFVCMPIFRGELRNDDMFHTPGAVPQVLEQDITALGEG